MTIRVILLAFFVSLCLSPTFVLSQAINPPLSLNINLSRPQLQNLPSNAIYIQQAVLKIFTGSYNGTSSDLNKINNLTIDQMLDFPMQILATVINDQENLDITEKQSLCLLFIKTF